MASLHNDDSSADEATSSLGDSSYDFVDDRSVITTDDESQDELAESITSSDDPELVQPENSSEFNRPANVHANPRTYSDKEMPSTSQHPQTPILTPKDGPSTAENHHDHILFDEPSVIEWSSKASEVSYTLDFAEGRRIVPLMSQEKELAVRIRQTMASHHLNLGHESYRVLYVGDYINKKPVLQKLASALAASPQASALRNSSTRASKFNVVPVSAFGEETPPEVILLDWSGIDLEVEQCKHASFLETPGGNDILQITLTDDSTVRSTQVGQNFKIVDDWKLPDLAVFSTSQKENIQEKRNHRLARMFMSRHAIPSLVITGSLQWGWYAEDMKLGQLTPHICLEDTNCDTPESKILKRLPIDLANFQKIDAGQMNRNLACLANAKSVREQTEIPMAGNSDAQKQQDAITKFCPHFLLPYYSFMRQALELPSARYTIGLVLIGFCAASILGLAGSYLSGSLHSAIPASDHNTMASSTPVHVEATSSSISLSSLAGSSTPRFAVNEASKYSPSDTAITSMLLDHSFQAPNRSEKFQLHVLGDTYIVMMPPHWFAKLKRAPMLSYKVTRNDLALPYKQSILFDGVYVLQIPREEAHGSLDVEIWTDSRPIFHQSLEVDFGSSWLKGTTWKQATRVLTESLQNELSQMQTGLTTVYDKTKAELSTMVRRNREIMARPKQAGIARRFKEGAKATDLAVAQTRDLVSSIYYRLRNGSQSSLSKLRKLGKAVATQTTLYSKRRTATVIERLMAGKAAATIVDMDALMDGFSKWKGLTTRNAQKMALKTWWRIKGLPTVEAHRSKGSGPNAFKEPPASK